MTRAQKLARARELYPSYDITGVTSTTREHLRARAASPYSNKSLDELYRKPSQAKRQAWDWVERTYEPRNIIDVSGNCMTFSVLLETHDGVTMHVTRANNYLVEVEE